VATRPSRKPGFSLLPTGKAVDVNRLPSEKGLRLEKGSDVSGTPVCRLVVPTPTANKEEHVIDLSFLSALPRMGEALADALLQSAALINCIRPGKSILLLGA
jgi:hypothetical protein